MKEVEIKRGTRACDKKHLNGCGRTIKSGEIAYLQQHSSARRKKRRYLCKECFERRSY